MRRYIRSALIHSYRDEKGVVAILVALLLVALIGFASLAVDVGLLIKERHEVGNALDAASLAAAMELPFDGVEAEAVALQYITANHPGIDTDTVDITFRCIVGDRNGDGQPDPGDIPAICNPGDEVFTCDSGVCASLCSFIGDNTCNTIVLEASKEVSFFLAPVIGVLDKPTGPVEAAAYRAQPTIPLDLVMIIDRTGSMSKFDLDNAKNGAKAVLELYNPELQHVALGVLGPKDPADPCDYKAAGDGGQWLAVPLSDDYKNADGSLNTSSALVSTINCLKGSRVGTNLGGPVKAARQHLETSGRPDVKQGIILFTDGAANRPRKGNPCSFAGNQADLAKNQDIEIFTIGFGVGNDRCEDESSGPYENERVTRLLADMATDSDNNGCTNEENADGDHFLCEPAGADLEFVFTQAARVLAAGVSLVYVPK